jgi:uncharacterized iron-regulated protein
VKTRAFLRIWVSLLFLLSLLLATEDCSGYRRALRLSDGKQIALEEMIEEIRKASFVFVGETHDNEKHHEAQLAIIKALDRSGLSVVLGLEMFRAVDQGELDRWVSGKLGLREFLRLYYESWGFPWPLYKDIFLYARDNSIPVLGLNVPKEIVRKVSSESFSSLTPEELRQLPPGISCDIDEAYMEFMRRIHKAHPGGRREFVNFCEAQMVWDKSMAWHLARFAEKNPGRTVVVLAGITHSWKRGIPEQLSRQSDLNFAVILPEPPGNIDRDTLSTEDADYILID